MIDVRNSDLFEREDKDYDTFIASDIKFSGSVKFEKPVVVKGVLSGRIESTSDLFIDTNSVINADILADRVLIKGSVNGNINASKIIYIASSASVKGDVTAAQVILEPGSTYSGFCNMIKE